MELRPFSGKDVELEASWIKQREDLDVAYLQSVEADRLLHNFRVTAGLPSLAKPLEGWESPGVGLRGHFTGHYLSALSVLAERYGTGGLPNGWSIWWMSCTNANKRMGTVI